MAQPTGRPLSPHIQVYRWGPHMAVSIFHRVTGFGLATMGAIGLLWWLYAISSGPEAYTAFLDCVMADEGKTFPFALAGFNLLPFLVLLGLSWAFFQHMFSGLRHLVLDTGAGYELVQNRLWSLAVFVAAAIATIALWVRVFMIAVEG